MRYPQHSSVSNSRDFGLTPEQLKQATEAAVKGATEAEQEHIDRISETLGGTKSAAKNLLVVKTSTCSAGLRISARTAALPTESRPIKRCLSLFLYRNRTPIEPMFCPLIANGTTVGRP